MVLTQRVPQDFLKDLQARARRYPTMLDLEDQITILKTVIRRFNMEVYSTRFLLLSNKGMSIDMTPYSCDEVITVTVPKSLDVFIGEFGLLPFFAVNNVLDLENLEEYLVFKATWSMIRRQYGNSFSWSYLNGTLNINGNYNRILVEYLPFISSEVTQDNLTDATNPLKWFFYDTEFLYICDLLWIEFNKRNQEILFSSNSLGIGKEAQAVLEYWDKQMEAKTKEFLSQSVLTFDANEGNN